MSEEQIGQSPSSKKKEIEFLTYTREAHARGAGAYAREEAPLSGGAALPFQACSKNEQKGYKKGRKVFGGFVFSSEGASYA